MILETNIVSGKSIYDYSMSLYGGYDNVVDLVKLNPFLINMNCDAMYLVDEDGNYILDEFGNKIITELGGLGKFIGKKISYDTSIYSPNVPQVGTYVSKVSSPIKTYLADNGQSIYDIALYVYGGFDNIIKLFSDSGINDINKSNLNGLICNFDVNVATDYSLRNYIQSKGIIFNTSTEYNYLVDEYGDYILDEFGHRIIM